MGQQMTDQNQTAQTDGGQFPRDDEIDSSMEDVRQHKNPFERLFSPRSKAAILAVLLEHESEPLTVTEMSEQSDEITNSSFSRQKEDLLEYGVMVERGKRGNAQTYSLNVEHPVAQSLKMTENLITWGKTPLLVDEEYLGQPDEDYDDAE